MLKDKALSELKDKKNLLAFSGGVDSTALFFLLLNESIKFDIAIVDYAVREQSKDEIEYAKKLSQENNLTCHILESEHIDSNFEYRAREVRYNFFEELVSKHKYDNVITAHHLGDRFEWMLMQFCKGAGCAELAGMKSIEYRGTYSLIRPLLHVSKNELLDYLHKENIRYFIDESNLDENIKRNSFRHKFTDPLLKDNLNGIKKSFEYLDIDRDELITDIDIVTLNNFAYFKSSSSIRSDIFAIDKYIKSKMHIITASERELLKQENTIVLGRKFLITKDRGYIFISPYIQNNNMTHKFKEECRVIKIEPKLRPFLFEDEDSFLKVKELLTSV